LHIEIATSRNDILQHILKNLATFQCTVEGRILQLSAEHRAFAGAGRSHNRK